MFRLILGYFICLVLLACQPSEDQKNKAKIPGDGEKKLTIFQSREIQSFMGALGDLSSVSSSLFSQSWRVQQSPKTINRENQRRVLRASMDLHNCEKIPVGDVFGGDFSMSIGGSRCGVEISYLQSREIRNLGQGKYKETIEFNQSYEEKKSGVNSDVMHADWKGLYTYEKTQRNGNLRKIKRATLTMEARSRKAGPLTYKLEESSTREYSNVTKKWIETYVRTDRFDVVRKYQATLYKVVETTKKNFLEATFYLNGKEISESEYIVIMQDLNHQVGIELFTTQDFTNSHSLWE